MRKLIIWTFAPATLALIATFPDVSNAAKQNCFLTYGLCENSCVGELLHMCRRRCREALDACTKKETGGKGNRPQGSSGAKGGGGVAKDPKSTTGTRPPLDNKWHGPTSVPKGGTWHGPASGGNGPILKSGGAKR